MAESSLIGRLCVKLSGREAGRECIIVGVEKGNFVVIDGNVKRRRCNLIHLDISEKVIKIKKDASTSDLQSAMEKEGIKVIKRKNIEKKRTLRPKKIKGKKEMKEEKPKENKKSNESKKQRKDSK